MDRGSVDHLDGTGPYVTGKSDNALSWYERNASTGALSYGGMLKDGVNGMKQPGLSLYCGYFRGWKSCLCNS